MDETEKNFLVKKAVVCRRLIKFKFDPKNSVFCLILRLFWLFIVIGFENGFISSHQKKQNAIIHDDTVFINLT